MARSREGIARGALMKSRRQSGKYASARDDDIWETPVSLQSDAKHEQAIQPPAIKRVNGS